MKKDIPEYIRKQRGDWGQVNPVTKVIPNKKKNPRVKHKGHEFDDQKERRDEFMKHTKEWHKGFENGLKGEPFNIYESYDWMCGYFIALKQSAVAKPQGDNK